MQAPTTSPCRCEHSWLNIHIVGPCDLGSDFGNVFDALQNFGVIRYPPNSFRPSEITQKKKSFNIVFLISKEHNQKNMESIQHNETAASAVFGVTHASNLNCTVLPTFNKRAAQQFHYE